MESIKHNDPMVVSFVHAVQTGEAETDCNPSPTPEDINEAFWQACHGGQRRVAEYLLTRGADIKGFPGYTTQTALDAVGNLDTRRDIMIAWMKSKSAKSSKQG